MKITSYVYRWLASCLLVAGFFISGPALAQADIVDDFADLLEKCEQVKVDIFPVKGADIRTSKGLFTCLEQGGDVLVCVNNFKNTSAGQKMMNEYSKELPSWAWDLLGAYVAFVEDDYWGVVYHMTEAVICVIAQVMLGGFDVCNLIEELIAFAKNAWDYAVTMVAFIKEVAAVIGDVAGEVYCFFAGCDEDTPPEQVAYAWFYVPELLEGVARRKVADPNAFDLLLAKVKAQALAPIEVGPVKIKLPKEAVDIAEGAYIKAVDSLWGVDMMQKILPALGKMRGDFNASQVKNAADHALQAYESSNPHWNSSFSPSWYIKKFCTDHFDRIAQNGVQIEGASMQSIHRWIVAHETVAQTNLAWCQDVFYEKNKDNYLGQFVVYLAAHSCPTLGLKCETTEAYKACRDLLGDLGKDQYCSINIAKVGEQAAAYIARAFLQGGSKPENACATTLAGGAPPQVDFVCGRPTQPTHCEAIYGEFKKMHKLPQEVLRCVQGGATVEYQVLIDKVRNAAGREPLNKYAPEVPLYRDPLLVRAGIPLDEVENSTVLAGFTYIGMANPSSSFNQIDGMLVPTIWNGMDQNDLKVDASVLDKKLVKTVETGVDPIARLTSDIDSKLMLSDSIKGTDSVNSIAAKVTVADSLAAPAQFAGAGQGGQQQTQVMSGQMPAGSTAPETRSATDTEPRLQPKAPEPALPDITAVNQVTFAGMAVNWGGMINLDTRAAQAALNGVCTFPVQYTLRNMGAGAAAMFKTAWTNSSVPGILTTDWRGLAPGSSQVVTGTINLRPGQNMLTLSLDQMNQVKETNKANNILRVNVNVTGTCGAAAGMAPPSARQPVAPAEVRLPPATLPQPNSQPPSAGQPVAPAEVKLPPATLPQRDSQPLLGR
jgi:hypothetical protein